MNSIFAMHIFKIQQHCGKYTELYKNTYDTSKGNKHCIMHT